MRFMAVACGLLLPATLAAPALADRAHDLAQRAQEIQPERCRDVKKSETCHGRYPGGCSRGANPGYDAYLNFLKNQLPDPKSSVEPVRFLAVQDFEALEAKTPRALGKRNHAEHAEALADLGEGNIAGLIGYLYYANVSPPESARKGETSNCQLTGEANSDYHIGIGFDPGVARKLREGQRVDRKILLRASVIVEMTPHYRARYQPRWNIRQVAKALGRQVKAVGQLMHDNEHVEPGQNCGHDRANLRSCWRRSAWEIHPVTEFSVCTAGTVCARDSASWTPLAEIE